MKSSTTSHLYGMTGNDLRLHGELCSTRPAAQQPPWEDLDLVRQIREQLAELPGLVPWHEVFTLRALLADVALGRRQVLQAGDCAEDPAECTPGHIARKATLLDVLAGAMWLGAHKPVVKVGRIAGQFGKPRSRPTERVDGRELPAYRGHMVNSPKPDPELRRPDPKRLLAGYWAASAAVDGLRCRPTAGPSAMSRAVAEPWVWTSHEALLLDYELPMLRRDPGGGLLLTSTHWPWVGERTRQVDGAHVAMLAGVVNPVACKVGPSMSAEELVALCERLDPYRQSGRLTLIVRMGAELVAENLPRLVEAVRAAGHPVIWMCDPMHGNTVVRGGLKTRFLTSIIREVRRFQDAVSAAGGVNGGLHLETTPDPVTECVLDDGHLEGLADGYTSPCDPRLNVKQAVSVVAAWHG